MNLHTHYLFVSVLLPLKPDLHMVVRVAEHASEDASKRILKPSTYRLQISLVRDQYLRSLLPHGDQTIAGLLEKHVPKPMLNMTGYSHSYHSIKLIHYGSPQRDVLSDRMVC